CRGRRSCLWLSLSRADGCGADPGPGRDRGGRPSAERLDLLRALRKRLPGQDPVAADDAALARTGIHPPAEPAGVSLRIAAVGLAGAAPGALSRPRRDRRPGAGLGRASSRPVPQPAPGPGLDCGARPAGAGGPQLSQPVGRRTAAPAPGTEMTSARDDILAGI